jgi:hypothetical protein
MMRFFLYAMRRTSSFGAITTVLLAAAGCQEKIYEIALEPRGDKIERRLSLTRRDHDNGKYVELDDTDKKEVDVIRRVYRVAPHISPRDAIFSGTFENALPPDVGGDGHYFAWESPLGRVRIYVERFRGNDDLQTSLESRRMAVDEIVDFVRGWLESELHDDAAWPILRGFLDKRLRRDLQNVSLYAWSTNILGVSDSENALAEVAVRVAQYLVERQYASYEEAPALRRELENAFLRSDGGALIARAQRTLASRVGTLVKGRLTGAPGFFFADGKSAAASWWRYFEQTAYCQQHKEEFRDAVHARLASEVDATTRLTMRKRVDPTRENQEMVEAAFDKLLADAFPIRIRLLDSLTRVQLKLSAPREPFWTNGNWNATERRVEWSKVIANLQDPGQAPKLDWPVVCFAVWDEPNDQAQKQLLGVVCLTKHRLFQYCLWYDGLSREEKQEWDAFLARVKRDSQLTTRLKEFHFSNEPADRKEWECVASEGASALITVLGPL